MTIPIRRAGAAPVLALALLVPLCTAPGRGLAAQAPAAPPSSRLEVEERVSLDDAVTRALERSPQMARGEATLGSAQAGRRTAVGSFLPSLSVGSGASVASSNRFDESTQRVVSGSSDSYNAGVSASYSLFQGGRRFAEMDRTDSEITAARAGLEDQRQGVILRTKELYYAALEQEELLETARAGMGQAEQSLTLVRRQTEVGRGTRSDTLRARLDYARARQQVLQAETGTRAARIALGRQVGVSGPVAPTASETGSEEGLEPAPLPLGDQEILAIAEDASPQVRAARASARAADASISAARSGYLPNLSLSSGYTWANETAALSGGNTSWSLRLSGSYPLFDGFSRDASVERARDQARAARLEEENARLVAREQADGALQALRTSQEALEIAREAVAVAEEDLRVVRERYRLGVATILELVTSQVAVDEARADAVTARYDYVLARAQLEAVLGREL